MVLPSCKTVPKNEPEISDTLFPSWPSVVDENGDIVYFAAKTGSFEIYKDIDLNTDTITMEDIIVLPRWFWNLIYKYHLRTEYAIDCLNLKREKNK